MSTPRAMRHVYWNVVRILEWKDVAVAAATAEGMGEETASTTDVPIEDVASITATVTDEPSAVTTADVEIKEEEVSGDNALTAVADDRTLVRVTFKTEVVHNSDKRTTDSDALWHPQIKPQRPHISRRKGTNQQETFARIWKMARRKNAAASASRKQRWTEDESPEAN
ncbi:uncharacterized protein BDV17DRAFT_261153 [Aspergillus undulatus]|uniref:uncharacterized protein n=1 Tax=Aspergillus undulatus TaxID=1810928 RepID=UPI003CCDB296